MQFLLLGWDLDSHSNMCARGSLRKKVGNTRIQREREREKGTSQLVTDREEN